MVYPTWFVDSKLLFQQNKMNIQGYPIFFPYNKCKKKKKVKIEIKINQYNKEGNKTRHPGLFYTKQQFAYLEKK